MPSEIATNRLTLRPPGPGDRSLWVGLHRDTSLFDHAPRAMPPSDDAASADIDDCLAREGAGISLYLDELNDRVPFKAAATPAG